MTDQPLNLNHYYVAMNVCLHLRDVLLFDLTVERERNANTTIALAATEMRSLGESTRIPRGDSLDSGFLSTAETISRSDHGITSSSSCSDSARIVLGEMHRRTAIAESRRTGLAEPLD
jgi:hypothetical protein